MGYSYQFWLVKRIHHWRIFLGALIQKGEDFLQLNDYDKVILFLEFVGFHDLSRFVLLLNGIHKAEFHGSMDDCLKHAEAFVERGDVSKVVDVRVAY